MQEISLLFIKIGGPSGVTCRNYVILSLGMRVCFALCHVVWRSVTTECQNCYLIKGSFCCPLRNVVSQYLQVSQITGRALSKVSKTHYCCVAFVQIMAIITELHDLLGQRIYKNNSKTLYTKQEYVVCGTKFTLRKAIKFWLWEVSCQINFG